MDSLKPHWTKTQQRKLTEYLSKPGWRVAFWCSDAHGYSANGGDTRVRATVGAIHNGSLGAQPCGPGALHATDAPHVWRGARVWIVALENPITVEPGKYATTGQRVVIGEILPQEALSHSVGVRLGRKDLSCADLYRADLYRADLYRANLSDANMSFADLSGANMSFADLSGANMSCADLYRADLSGANLSGANLSGANLSGADLYGADLYGAYLSGANLSKEQREHAKAKGAIL